ncbi:hypothetical protein QBC39DRAFT_362145 [Podospora conica]|nr:hypothetical protein QBC39DRAFT_362145 [Schizothecium conicum]
MRLSLLGAVAPLLASVAADHLQVTVGKDGKLQFQPEQLTAKVGDTITYSFFARNHSVTQSSFDKPCQPLDKGFFSGFVPTASPDTAAPTTFTITVQDTKPIWVYCGQVNGNHCQSGMLHAINPPPDSFAKFQTAAKTAATSTSPAGGPVGGVRKLRVEVGKDGLTFTPNKINEIPGTVVEFGFNPRNHTVTQSSFMYPCQPLNKGFSSGFIATTKSPSGAVFQVTVNDTHPIWFYCGQPNGNHCQSGMVGSINADTEGKFTQEAFIQKAKEHVVASWIPHWAPIGGRVFVDGKEIRDFNLNGGNAIDVDALQGNPSQPPASSLPGGPPGGKPTGVRVTAAVPKPTNSVPSGPSKPPTFDHKAGGGKPTNYGWADSISDAALQRLYTLSFIEQIIVKVLMSGYDKLARGGAWAGAYPVSIVDILGTMGAQRIIHGATTEECLQHYNKPILRECTLKPAATTGQVAGFLHAVKSLNALGIGALIDTTAAVAATDPWLVPLVATEIGSKARMAAVINLMQNHTAAPMPREVLVPADLAWSYVMTHFVASCPDVIAGLPAKPYPPIQEVVKEEAGGRTVSLTVKYDAAAGQGGQHYVAWMGSYGLGGFSPIHGGKVAVPEDMFGNVWIAVVSNPNVAIVSNPNAPAGGIGKHMVAGPETVWIKRR